MGIIFLVIYYFFVLLYSGLTIWHCWVGIRKSIWPVRNWLMRSRSPHGKEQFWGRRAAHCKVQGCSAMSCTKTSEAIEMPFGIRTRVGPRSIITWGAHWRHLAYATEPSMCDGNAACCQVTLTTCYLWISNGGGRFAVLSAVKHITAMSLTFIIKV